MLPDANALADLLRSELGLNVTETNTLQVNLADYLLSNASVADVASFNFTVPTLNLTELIPGLNVTDAINFTITEGDFAGV